MCSLYRLVLLNGNLTYRNQPGLLHSLNGLTIIESWSLSQSYITAKRLRRRDPQSQNRYSSMLSGGLRDLNQWVLCKNYFTRQIIYKNRGRSHPSAGHLNRERMQRLASPYWVKIICEQIKTLCDSIQFFPMYQVAKRHELLKNSVTACKSRSE